MSKKYEYKVITIEQKLFAFKEPNYEKIINEHASQGWRLKQVTTTGGGSVATNRWFDKLIFEREING